MRWCVQQNETSTQQFHQCLSQLQFPAVWTKWRYASATIHTTKNPAWRASLSAYATNRINEWPNLARRHVPLSAKWWHFRLWSAIRSIIWWLLLFVPLADGGVDDVFTAWWLNNEAKPVAALFLGRRLSLSLIQVFEVDNIRIEAAWRPTTTALPDWQEWDARKWETVRHTSTQQAQNFSTVEDNADKLGVTNYSIRFPPQWAMLFDWL